MEFICRNDSAGRRWDGRVYATGSMQGRMEQGTIATTYAVM